MPEFLLHKPTGSTNVTMRHATIPLPHSYPPCLQHQEQRTPSILRASKRPPSLPCRNARSHGCPSLRAGGVSDHVHILFDLSRTKTIAEIVETVKTASSKWIKAKDPRLANFHWQSGYAAFSVSQSDADHVVAYIANQAEHHRKRTFQEEYRLLLEKYQVPFDERYVWD